MFVPVRSSCDADIFTKRPAKYDFIYINLFEKHKKANGKVKKEKRPKFSCRAAQNLHKISEVKTLQPGSYCLPLGIPIWARSKDGALYMVWQELLTLLMERGLGNRSWSVRK
jgi:hypothetical protein